MRRPTATIATLAATGLLAGLLSAGGVTASAQPAAQMVSVATASTTALPEAPTVKIKLVKLAKRPGKVRVVNNSAFSLTFAWGHAKRNKADGKVFLAKKSSRVIRVRRTDILWVAANKKRGASDLGYLQGIKLPKGQKPLPPSPRL